MINYGDSIELNEPLTYYGALREWYTIDNDKAWIDSNNTIYNVTNTYSASNICGSRLNTSDVSVTLKAKWRLTRIYITYNSNGGTLVYGKYNVCPDNVSCTGNKSGDVFKYSRANNSTAWAADGVRNYVKTNNNRPTLLIKKNGNCGNGYWYVNKPNSTYKIHEDDKFSEGKKIALKFDNDGSYYNTLKHKDISVKFYASSFNSTKLCP